MNERFCEEKRFHFYHIRNYALSKREIDLFRNFLVKVSTGELLYCFCFFFFNLEGPDLEMISSRRKGINSHETTIVLILLKHLK